MAREKKEKIKIKEKRRDGGEVLLRISLLLINFQLIFPFFSPLVMLYSSILLVSIFGYQGLKRISIMGRILENQKKQMLHSSILSIIRSFWAFGIQKFRSKKDQTTPDTCTTNSGSITTLFQSCFEIFWKKSQNLDMLYLLVSSFVCISDVSKLG